MNETINNITVLAQRLENTKDSKEILHLRGQLINMLKKATKDVKNAEMKMKLDLVLYDEMKKHKAHIEKMRKEAKVKKYPISERLALRVKDISVSQEIFMKKLDLPGKLKSGVIGGAVSGIFSIAITAGFTLLTGGLGTPLLSIVSSAIPTACYMGLSSVITSLSSGTQKSELYKKYDNAPGEAKKELDFCQKYITNNEPFIRALAGERQLTDIKDRIKNEEQLIREYQKIIAQAPTDQIRQVITLEMVDVMKTLEYNYAYLENEYVNNRAQLSQEDYQKVVARKNALKVDIESNSSFFKDSAKEVGKNIVKQTAVSYAARIALAAMFPNSIGSSLAFDGTVSDALSPFLYTALGNVFSISSVSKSIKAQKTDYTGTILKMTRPELFEKQRDEAAGKVSPALA